MRMIPCEYPEKFNLFNDFSALQRGAMRKVLSVCLSIRLSVGQTRGL